MASSSIPAITTLRKKKGKELHQMLAEARKRAQEVYTAIAMKKEKNTAIARARGDYRLIARIMTVIGELNDLKVLQVEGKK